MMHFDVNDFELVKFYSYTSVVPANSVLIEVHDDDTHHQRFANHLRSFYTDLRKEAAHVSGDTEWKFTDNKTVFKLRRKENGSVIYVGYKDGRLTVGLSVFVWDGHIYEFETKTWSEYVTQKAD